jgi:hypothetical protein
MSDQGDEISINGGCVKRLHIWASLAHRSTNSITGELSSRETDHYDRRKHGASLTLYRGLSSSTSPSAMSAHAGIKHILRVVSCSISWATLPVFLGDHPTFPGTGVPVRVYPSHFRAYVTLDVVAQTLNVQMMESSRLCSSMKLNPVRLPEFRPLHNDKCHNVCLALTRACSPSCQAIK